MMLNAVAYANAHPDRTVFVVTAARGHERYMRDLVEPPLPRNVQFVSAMEGTGVRHRFRGLRYAILFDHYAVETMRGKEWDTFYEPILYAENAGDYP